MWRGGDRVTGGGEGAAGGYETTVVAGDKTIVGASAPGGSAAGGRRGLRGTCCGHSVLQGWDGGRGSPPLSGGGFIALSVVPHPFLHAHRVWPRSSSLLPSSRRHFPPFGRVTAFYT